MSEINQPGATVASIPLPTGYVLDKGVQPRLPKEGEWFLATHTDEATRAMFDFPEDRKFIITRSTPDDSWWPKWLLADSVSMDGDGEWFGYTEGTQAGVIRWRTEGEFFRLDRFLDLNLPDWPTERFADSKIMNPHKRGEQ